MIGPLTEQQLRRLMRYGCVEDVENDGCPDDRFLVHLVDGFDWCQDGPGGQVTRTKGFGSYNDARYWLDKRVQKVAG